MAGDRNRGFISARLLAAGAVLFPQISASAQPAPPLTTEWSAPVAIEPAPDIGHVVSGYDVERTPEGEFIAAFCQQTTATEKQVAVFTRSADGGGTWSVAVPFYPDWESLEHPGGYEIKLAAGENKTILAAWVNYGNIPFLGRSPDGGQTWLPPVQMDDVPSYGKQMNVGYCGNNCWVFIVFRPDAMSWISRSTDNGATWGKYQPLGFTAVSETIHSFGTGETALVRAAGISFSYDNGTTFSHTVPGNTAATDGQGKWITVNSGTPVVNLRQSTDRGMTFVPMTAPEPYSGVQQVPEMVGFDGEGNIVLRVQDYRWEWFPELMELRLIPRPLITRGDADQSYWEPWSTPYGFMPDIAVQNAGVFINMFSAYSSTGALRIYTTRLDLQPHTRVGDWQRYN